MTHKPSISKSKQSGWYYEKLQENYFFRPIGEIRTVQCVGEAKDKGGMEFLGLIRRKALERAVIYRWRIGKEKDEWKRNRHRYKNKELKEEKRTERELCSGRGGEKDTTRYEIDANLSTRVYSVMIGKAVQVIRLQ